MLAENENSDNVEILIREGNYIVTGLNLKTYPFKVTIKAYEDDDVSLSGGISIGYDDFTEITDEAVIARFSDEQKRKIKVVDLKSKGFSAEQIGVIHPIGSGVDETRYDNIPKGTNIDVFRNGERLENARYPNEGFTYIVASIDNGETYFVQEDALNNEGRVIANPKGGIIQASHDVMERAKTWAEEEPWAFGYFYMDWCDSSTPIKSFDFDNDYVEFTYYTVYGYLENMYYYFFNILEELDTVNEYYIDRENLLMYCYFEEDTDTEFIIPTLNTPILSGTANNVTLENLTFNYAKDRLISIAEPEYIGNPARSTVKYNFFVGCAKNESYDKKILDFVDIGPNYSINLNMLNEDGYSVSGKGIVLANADEYKKIDYTVIGRYKEAEDNK